jgi:uncharacterized protein with GYD domain
MALFLYQAAYTPESWATQIKEQQDVRERVNPVVEQFGGRLVGVWYSFGEYDVVGIFEMPDNVSTATIAIAFAAGGALKAAKTTPLMTVEEGLQALRNVGGADYRPPTS